MTIATLSDYESAVKEKIYFSKNWNAALAANLWVNHWAAGSQPSAGTLAAGNTANGIVPTDATTGAPTISFGSGRGFLTSVEFCSVTAHTMRLLLLDRLFVCGAYAFNASATLVSQPSFSSRVPGGTDFHGLRLWFEAVTAFTGNPSVTVTYTNQSGIAGRSTGAFSCGNNIPGNFSTELPLQAGDTGVQKIESVTCAVASVGTFNVLVARPLWSARIGVAQSPFVHGLDATGMPEIFGDSCLCAYMCPDSSASTQGFDLALEVASK